MSKDKLTEEMEALRKLSSAILEAYKLDCQAWMNSKQTSQKLRQEYRDTIERINLVLDERKVH